MELFGKFPRYERYDPVVPVFCITPDIDGCFHRFFDTSPISPSGRYVGLTRLINELHEPSPGQTADIVLVDLKTGEYRKIAETSGFGTQLGAQVQWGCSDNELFYNDLDADTWKPYAVCLDPETGKKRAYEATVYMASSDGSTLASPCLIRTSMTQGGYGVTVPDPFIPVNVGAPGDDGVYLTDTSTGETRLAVSYEQICESIGDKFSGPPYEGGGFYGFHVKWNPQGTRLMFVTRYRKHRGGKHVDMPCDLITFKPDGSDIQLALPYESWSRGGHHPNWAPDGEHITQNLVTDSGYINVVQFSYNGSEPEKFCEIKGSGHPTLHPDLTHILTDAYVHEDVSFGDGTTPLRWINISENSETTLVRMRTQPVDTGPANVLRVDPHPAWDPTYTCFVFNGCPDGYRKVFIADMSEMVG